MSEQSLFGNLFLSVGAMKAGTTWLYTVLNRHPELYFTPEKELHYFYHRYVDNSLLSDQRRLTEAKNRYLYRFDPEQANIEMIRTKLHWVAAYLSRPVDDLWYRGLFAGQRRETYGCDFSNLYALLPTEAWQRIASDCQTLRVLYTLRHPMKRLWSHVKFHLQFTKQIDKLDTWTPEEFRDFARQDFMWVNAEYGHNLRMMKAGLPPDALKVLFYEDLHADEPGTLAEIEDFLGIARFAYPEAALNRKVNTSVEHKMPEFFPDLFADEVARITSELEAEGLQIPQAWRAPQLVS